MVMLSKKCILEELVQTVISEMSFPKYFWENSINTACHVLNEVTILLIQENIPYKLL